VVDIVLIPEQVFVSFVALVLFVVVEILLFYHLTVLKISSVVLLVKK
jgi:hypothetical protein